MTAPDVTADTPDSAAAPTRLEPLALVRARNLGRSGPVLASTPLGTIDAGAIADVDGAGSVNLRGAAWSLDWWIGAEDRWHHPSREAAVRQHPLGDAPVIETAMRVPGGDVLHRAYGVRATSVVDGVSWDDSGVVVEVENLTAVPVALAFAVRPFTLGGAGRVDRVEVDGPVVRVDGRVALVLSRTPARAAHGAPGEPSERLAAGDDVDGGALSVTAGPDGLEVAVVVPLPHQVTVRVLLPRVAAPARRRLLRSNGPAAEPGAGWVAPEADAIASGWEAHTRAAASVELPEPLLDQVLSASQRSLILAAGDDFFGAPSAAEPGGVGASAATRAAVVCEALARSGVVEPLEPLARALVVAQRLNGVVKLDDGSDATVALLHAAAPLLEQGSQRWVDDLLGPVAKAVHRLGKIEGRGVDQREVGGAPAWSAVEALARCAPALRAIGQPDVAAEAERVSATRAGVDPTGSGPASASPRADGVIDLFTSVTAARARLRSGDRAAVVDLVELARIGEPGATVDRVDDVAVPVGSVGYDAAAVAARLCAVLDTVLLDGPDGPVLVPGWPAVWWGQQLEVYRVRTRWGSASFGIRWHGERPAVLWEIEPAAGVDASSTAPELTAPALDPAWRGRGWSGEALLSPVEVPSTFVAIRSAAAPVADAPSAPVQVETPLDPPPDGMTFS